MDRQQSCSDPDEIPDPNAPPAQPIFLGYSYDRSSSKEQMKKVKKYLGDKKKEERRRLEALDEKCQPL